MRDNRQAGRQEKLDFLAACQDFSASSGSKAHTALLAQQHAEAVRVKAKLYQAILQLSTAAKAQRSLEKFLQLGQILLSYLDASSAGAYTVRHGSGPNKICWSASTNLWVSAVLASVCELNARCPHQGNAGTYRLMEAEVMRTDQNLHGTARLLAPAGP